MRNNKVKITYIFGSQKKKIETEKGKTILETSHENGFPQVSACGGLGICTTCMCIVKKNPENLNGITSAETDMGFTDGIHRLACQASINGDIEIEL